MNMESITQSFNKELSQIAYSSLQRLPLFRSLLELLNQSFSNSISNEITETEKQVISISLGLLVALLMMDEECFTAFS